MTNTILKILIQPHLQIFTFFFQPSYLHIYHERTKLMINVLSHFMDLPPGMNCPLNSDIAIPSFIYKKALQNNFLPTPSILYSYFNDHLFLLFLNFNILFFFKCVLKICMKGIICLFCVVNFCNLL